MNIAIVAVAYNRCDSLSRLLKSLENAYYDSLVTLIISVDKSNTDIVEKFADNYVWAHGEKIVDKHRENLGLRSHMMSLGKWFERFDAIVVLEDDIVVSPNFYAYTYQAVEKYYECPEIAGISLYGFSVNYQTGKPFVPFKDEHDAYFMNCAMSWGEVWMRNSWTRFYEWYLCHQDFPVELHLPKSICLWNKKSWLKYHTRYCIEENKFFVFPYISLSTNYGDVGEHNKGNNSVFQVILQEGIKHNYDFPEMGGAATYYDGFFENIELYNKLGFTCEDLCIDLQGEQSNRLKRRYWLTTSVANYKPIKTYGLSFRPIEKNIFVENPGCDIFLYDTKQSIKNKKTDNKKHYLFSLYLNSSVPFLRNYGWKQIFVDMFSFYSSLLKSKI